MTDENGHLLLVEFCKKTQRRQFFLFVWFNSYVLPENNFKSLNVEKILLPIKFLLWSLVKLNLHVVFQHRL